MPTRLNKNLREAVAVEQEWNSEKRIEVREAAYAG